MNKLKLLPLYIVLAFFSGASLLYFQWPFYDKAIAMALVSVPIMLVLSRKWIPILLFAILLVSIGYALQEPSDPMASVGTYFLLSIFHFSLWSITEQIKKVEEETKKLKVQRVELLEKGGELRALSLQEFVEQALWLLKTNNRHERAWLMEVVPAIECPKQTAELERAALGAITRERDLVTSKHGAVYLLVKETEEGSLQPLLKKLEREMASQNGAVQYEVRRTVITNVGEMGSLLN
ncbi:MAG: hypothetical protein ACQEV0_08340 [Bacillota bacterium]